MANISAIKLPNGTTYNLKDKGALQLTGGSVTGPVSFGDSVSIDEATVGDLVVNGSASFTNNLQANTINGVTVGSNPKFTDTNTVTTATTTGSGNAVTAITASNGALTVTKGTTFLTSHQDISGKADKSATVSNVAYDSTNKKITKTINGTTSDVVTVATLKTALGQMPASDVYSWAKAESKPTYTASEVGAATSSHTHTISLATDTGTSTITLASAGKYKLTAGGSSVIFTMPTIPTVSYPVTSVNSKTGAVSLTYSDVGAAASSHTHNYAGSSSAGGAATSLANFKVTTTTNLGVDAPGTNAVGYISGLTKAAWNYQQTDGALYTQWYSASWIHEIFGDYRTGQISIRGRNNGTWGSWRRVLDESNWSTFISIPTSLPASDVYSWAKASTKPSYTSASVATGITASTTATKTTLGTAFTIPNVTSAGSASTWTFGATTVGDGTLAGAVDSTDTSMLIITAGTKSVQQKTGGGNGSAPTLGTAFTVPNVTGNTSATVSITDPKHSHTIS